MEVFISTQVFIFLHLLIGESTSCLHRDHHHYHRGESEFVLSENEKPFNKRQTNIRIPANRIRKKVSEDCNINCTFTGNLAIKDECWKYFNCKKRNEKPRTKFCPVGTKFDHLFRECVRKIEARCVTKFICPNDETTYPNKLTRNRQAYLQCKNGVPYPTFCLPTEVYNRADKKCEIDIPTIKL